jgi:hypothetical protein
VIKNNLVIDDETMTLDFIKAILVEDMSYTVTFSDSQAGMNEAELTEGVRKAKAKAKISKDSLATRVLEADALGFLKKPFEIAKVLDLPAD